MEVRGTALSVLDALEFSVPKAGIVAKLFDWVGGSLRGCQLIVSLMTFSFLEAVVLSWSIFDDVIYSRGQDELRSSRARPRQNDCPRWR